MALGRSKPTVAEIAAPKPPVGSALTASAAVYKMSDTAWRSFRFGDVGWQSELWDFYDSIGEYAMLCRWVGGACGRTRIYVANVDDDGNVQQEVDATTDPDVAALANNLFGGPAAKAECLRALGVNLTVAGEAYIVGLSGNATPDGQDQWMIVSGVELRRWGGNTYLQPTLSDGTQGDKTNRTKLTPGQDMIVRVWNPHPRRMMWADSPSHAATPILAEIHKLTRFIFAQLDSRLANGGVWILPDNLDLPGDDATPEGTAGLLQKLMETAAAGLKGQGTAAGIVPTIMEAPADLFDRIKAPLVFSSELSAQAMELRQEALQRLSWAMDTPPEVMKGHGDTNHWGSFNIDESTIKQVIEPLMNRICDAATKAILNAQLILLGKDPAKYTYWFDTAGLTVRPLRLQDTLNLYKEQLVSWQAVLAAGAYAVSDHMGDEESAMIFIRQVIIADPQLMASPEIRVAAGIPLDLVGKDVEIGIPTPSDTPPANGQNTVAPSAELPVTPALDKSKAIGGPRGPQKALAASGDGFDYVALVVAGEATVRRALEVAGGRLLRPQYRGQFSVPRESLHCHIPVTPADVPRVLEGAWSQFDAITSVFGVERSTALRPVLEDYVTDLLLTATEHTGDRLVSAMTEAGVFSG